MRRLIELVPETRRARVEPGLVLDRLREAAERHHLTFAPDPVDAQPLHPWRDDRQQLLRRPLA